MAETFATCGSGACLAGAACCIPRATNTANALGFQGAHGCCLSPCVQFPPYNVQICVLINSRTQVKISVGCATSADACDIYYPPTVAQDSWGRKCRMVSFSRQVPKGAFIRIQLCGLDGCSDSCYPSSYEVGGFVPNALQTFSVDGVSKLQTLLDVADDFSGEVTNPCYVKAACIGSVTGATAGDTGNACCQWYDPAQTAPVVRFSPGQTVNDLANLAIGTEFVFGPIGLR